MLAQVTPVSTVDFINYSVELLKQNNISEARVNAELILCGVLKCDRVSLYLNFDRPLTSVEINLLNEYLTRRINHEPVQYILGKTSFFGFDILVNKDVLIPRPETEILTEKLIDDIKASGKKSVSVFEIGSGSGCIPIALTKILERENISCEIFSVDVSQKAIDTAKENLVRNDLENKKIKFVTKDIFEIPRLTKSFDYIVSNPPYISKTEFNKLEPEVRDHEPEIALTDNDKGLKFFEKIFEIASDSLFNGKVFCEIGFGQKNEIETLLRKNNFKEYYFYKDYNNLDRVLEVRK